MKHSNENLQEKISILIRARYPLIYIVSWEEERVAVMLNTLATEAQKQLILWSTTEGFSNYSGKILDGEAVDPFTALNHIIEYQKPTIFVLKDFHPFMKDPVIIRKLRDLKVHLNRLRKTCFIVSPVLEVPIELEKLISVIDFDFPTIELLDTVLQSIIEPLKDNPKVDVSLSAEEKEQVLKSALGLTLDEAESVFAKSLVEAKGFVPSIIIKEKEQIIRKSGILEYYHSSEEIDDIGGLEYLKEWFSKRKRGFTEKARAYGLPFPKGLMLIGIPGTGKSLAAKAVASLWNLPLLRLDVGKVFGGIVGESEKNMRIAIKMAESVSPSILWIDEVEKGFAGVQSSNQTDAGTTSRVFGTFITWLQEKEKPVFVITTANNINQLPPELLRKGRFDEIFFVDLPSKTEREEIFFIHLSKRKRNPSKFDLKTLMSLTKGYSGAEIEQSIIAAMFEAFSEDREVETTDVINSIEDIVPLSRLMKEEISELRTWSQARARLASRMEEQRKHKIDIEI
ncbi:MAG: AAA family ATPase [Promethearchaeota archaeon]